MYQEKKEGRCLIVLEVCINIVCQFIMFYMGFAAVKTLIETDKKINYIQVTILLLLGAIVSTCIYQVEYKSIYTILMYLINIIIYKIIFKENIVRAILLASLVMVVTFIADIICGLILIVFFSTKNIREIWYLHLLATIITIINCLIIIFIIKKLKLNNKIDSKLEKISSYSVLIFLILTVIVLTIITYNFTINEDFNINIGINMAIALIFICLLGIFIKEKNNYSQLSSEYDNLYVYVQNFEDWIEKEQLNRHEYKNQLAVLRCLTKEKKAKEKIDEILEDNINIEGQFVTQLKTLPKGGIKGLMYYKAAIAQKRKLHLTTDVSIEDKGILSKLSEKEVRILCKLIGIYFDNAIEAAEESRKKNISIEIYELKDKVNFVFSNTFKRHKNMKDRNKKGVSTKGEGRGNGLYFAEKLIKENSWLDQKQEIIDNYYIQQITINKKNI